MTPRPARVDASTLPYARGIVAVAGVLPHAWAMFLIIDHADGYDPIWVVLVLWVACAIAPVYVALRLDRRGAVSRASVAVICGALLVVDVGAILVTDPVDRGTYGGWQVGAIGITLLVLAVVLPPGTIAWMAGVHGVITVVAGLSVPDEVVGRELDVVLMLGAAVVPPLAGASFVWVLLGRLDARRALVASALVIQTEAQAQEDVARLISDRLTELRGRVSPLLDEIARAGGLVDADQASRARALGERLRAEILEQREQARAARSLVVAGRPAEVQVLDGLGLLDAVSAEGAASLEAVVRSLASRLDAPRLTVAIEAGAHGARCVVSARAVDAAAAARDRVLHAVVDDAGGTLSHERDGMVVVEVIITFDDRAGARG